MLLGCFDQYASINYYNILPGIIENDLVTRALAMDSSCTLKWDWLTHYVKCKNAVFAIAVTRHRYGNGSNT